MSNYAEIRHDYISGPAVEGYRRPEDQGLFAKITIDAWKSNDDNESGEVLAAVIMSVHGDIIVDFHDNGCRMDKQVLEHIEEAQKELKKLWDEKAAGETVKV